MKVFTPQLRLGYLKYKHFVKSSKTFNKGSGLKMKKILFVLVLISAGISLAQTNKPFTDFDIGFYGGVNFYNSSDIRGDFIAELKTNLVSSLKLKASAGYVKTIQPESYTIKTYSENKVFDTLSIFYASKYNLVSKNYDIFPVTIGVQYTFGQNLFSPYLSIDFAYNFINTFLETSPPEVWSYYSLDEVPAEFKGERRTEELPKNSYGIILAAGTSYRITSNLNLDFRYLFKIDNKIVNTHHFIVGIYF